MTQRPVLTVLLGMAVGGSVILLILAILRNETFLLVTAAVATVILGLLLAAHLLGWRWGAQATVIALTLLTIVGNPASFTREQATFTVFLPTIIAAILLPWYWGIGAFAVTLLGIAVQSGGQGPLFMPDTLVSVITSGLGIAFAGFVARRAQGDAEANARRAGEEKARAEHQAHDLAEANELMMAQLDQQRELLDLVTTLETPAVPLADGVLFAPIVGHVDTRRAQALTTRLLETVSTRRARMVILDIAGVTVMDTAVAKGLLHTAQALRLLGCEVTISGISADIAVTLIQLGINLKEVRTARSPQEALANYLAATPVQPKGNGPVRNN